MLGVAWEWCGKTAGQTIGYGCGGGVSGDIPVFTVYDNIGLACRAEGHGRGASGYAFHQGSSHGLEMRGGEHYCGHRIELRKHPRFHIRDMHVRIPQPGQGVRILQRSEQYGHATWCVAPVVQIVKRINGYWKPLHGVVEACRTHGYYGLAAFKRFGKQG